MDSKQTDKILGYLQEVNQYLQARHEEARALFGGLADGREQPAEDAFINGMNSLRELSQNVQFYVAPDPNGPIPPEV